MTARSWVTEVADALHEVMCTTSHHDPPHLRVAVGEPAEPPCYAKYRHIAESVAPRLSGARLSRAMTDAALARLAESHPLRARIHEGRGHNSHDGGDPWPWQRCGGCGDMAYDVLRGLHYAGIDLDEIEADSRSLKRLDRMLDIAAELEHVGDRRGVMAGILLDWAADRTSEKVAAVLNAQEPKREEGAG